MMIRITDSHNLKHTGTSGWKRAYEVKKLLDFATMSYYNKTRVSEIIGYKYFFKNSLLTGGDRVMSAEIKYDQLLDAKGLSCPLPILKTKKAIEALAKDQVLKVDTTDPGSKNDMASWAKRTGNEIVKVEEGSGTFTCYIKKTA